MSEPIQNTTAAQERQKRIDEQTSVGKYAAKQVVQWGVMLIGAVAGYFAFSPLKNTKFAEKIGSLIAKRTTAPETVNELTQTYFPIVGAAIGTIAAGVVNTYGHWKKTEGETLGVKEINEDVANAVRDRAKFTETLNRQEDFIRTLIKERQEKGEIAPDPVSNNAAPAR